MLTQYQSSLARMKQSYSQGIGAKTLLEQSLTSAKDELCQIESDIQVWELVQMLFTKSSDFARQQLKLRIEETVTAALQAVFDQPMEFRIILSTYKEQAAAEWQIVSSYSDYQVASSPEDANGGGVVDVISLALRIALIELARPKVDGPLILDEIGKMVSIQFAPNIGYFLKQYAEKTGRQVLMVTHQDAFAEVAQQSFHVSKIDGVSEVRDR